MAETLWDGGPVLHQAPGVFPMGTDSILLAHFARPGAKDRILDLGTGSGILPVLLLPQSVLSPLHWKLLLPDDILPPKPYRPG